LVSRLTGDGTLDYEWAEDRGGYLYLIDGSARLGSGDLAAGDAARIRGPERIEVATSEFGELILIDTVLDFEPVGIWAR
ncbi:MAG: hypothetical protein KY394_01630, partial [Actinobacteria bacterium]|nr:hypothetical protein [Actinomycetota bacterium]